MKWNSGVLRSLKRNATQFLRDSYAVKAKYADIAFGRGGIQSLLILAENKTYRNRQK